MRNGSRIASLLLASALTGFSAASVSADTLNLTGANPAQLLNLYGSSMSPLPYVDSAHQVTAYAGVLDWTDQTAGSNFNKTIYTYCIDVKAVISQGNSYTFDAPESLSSANLNFGANSAGIVNGIYNLWNDSTNFGTAAGINGGAFGSANVSAIPDRQAAMFQVALWDIIYNEGESSAGLNFVALPAGATHLSSSDLSAALAAAHTDYNGGVLLNPTNVPNVEALYATDHSQNQAIYLGGYIPGPTPTPLPASFAAGLALLGLVGAGGCRRRTRGLQSAM